MTVKGLVPRIVLFAFVVNSFPFDSVLPFSLFPTVAGKKVANLTAIG